MNIKLQEAENILFEGKPENKIFAMWFFTKVIPGCIIASFITFFASMFLWTFFVAMPAGKEDIPFPAHILKIVFTLAPVWFVILLFYYYKLKDTFQYCITNQRCVFSGGIMVKRSRNVPYHKITDVEINQNIIERILGIYSLKIFTPGTGSVGLPGFEKAEIIFYGLEDAENPAQIIQGILKKYKATGE